MHLEKKLTYLIQTIPVEYTYFSFWAFMKSFFAINLFGMIVTELSHVGKLSI